MLQTLRINGRVLILPTYAITGLLFFQVAGDPRNGFDPLKSLVRLVSENKDVHLPGPHVVAIYRTESAYACYHCVFQCDQKMAASE